MIKQEELKKKRHWIIYGGMVLVLLAVFYFTAFAQNAHADTAIKNKSTKISNLSPGATVTVKYINDEGKEDILNSWSPSTKTAKYGDTKSTVVNLPNNCGTVTISFNGGTATVTLSNVNCFKKTIYLEIYSGERTGYKANGWKTVSDDGKTGMNDNTNPNPPLPDVWEDDYCLFYLGVSYTATEKAVVWAPVSTTVQYHKNDGGTSTASQTFTYGVAKQQFGKKTDGSPLWGTEKEDGFGGWDRPGYHILGWSESSTATKATYGTYSEVADSWIASKYPTVDLYAVWEPFY